MSYIWNRDRSVSQGFRPRFDLNNYYCCWCKNRLSCHFPLRVNCRNSLKQMLHLVPPSSQTFNIYIIIVVVHMLAC